MQNYQSMLVMNDRVNLIDTVQIVFVDSLIITNKRDIKYIKRRYLKKNKRNR